MNFYFANQVLELSEKLSHVLGEIPCGASDFDTAQRFSFVAIAGSFGVPFSISGPGADLDSMGEGECRALALRADPLKVRLEAEEILSGFNESAITWPPVTLAPPPPSATHARVCFPNRIFYRQGGSACIKCNYYSSPTPKTTSGSVASRPVVRPPPSLPLPDIVFNQSHVTCPPHLPSRSARLLSAHHLHLRMSRALSTPPTTSSLCPKCTRCE